MNVTLVNETAASRPSVDVGSNVTMSCSANGESATVGWLFIRSDTAEQFEVYEQKSVVQQYEGKFQAVADGNSSLILFNAQIEDNGWYVCVVKTGNKMPDKYVTIINVNSEDSGKCEHGFCLNLCDLQG